MFEVQHMDCPRCKKELESVTISDIPLELCLGCEGTFYDFDGLQKVFRLSEGQVRKTYLGISLENDTGGVDLEAPVACPKCGAEMERGRYLLSAR